MFATEAVLHASRKVEAVRIGGPHGAIGLYADPHHPQRGRDHSADVREVTFKVIALDLHLLCT